MIKTYYLNLEHRTDRKKHIENQLNKSKILSLNYHRFNAINGKTIHPHDVESGILSEKAIVDLLNDKVNVWGLTLTTGGLGVLLSYIELFKLISNENKPILLCEDDTEFSDDFDVYFQKIISELPIDFDLCYLGYGNNEIDKKPYSENLQIPTGLLHCIPSIYVSPTGAKKILSLLKNVEHQLDTVLFSNFNKLNVYVASKKITKIKNEFGTDIQGNINQLDKLYKKQNYIVSTLAVGNNANINAFKLAKDLQYFNQKLLVVTDNPQIFSNIKTVITIQYPYKRFSYNHKYLCYEHGLEHADAVVYMDCDVRIFYDDFDKCYTNFFFNISPGFHSSWNWGRVIRPSGGFFNSKDVNSRINGYGELALKLCNDLDIPIDDACHYQEGLIIVSKENEKEKMFIDTWKQLSSKLDEYEINNNCQSIGIGEGNLIGLAAQKSRMTIHPPLMCNIFGNYLKYNFKSHMRDYIKQYPTRKTVRLSDDDIIYADDIVVEFKDKKIDLSYYIYCIDKNLCQLEFQWNRKSQIDQLDHEFRIGTETYHFNSEITNGFTFTYNSNIILEHTYDWYGERNWKILFKI